MKLEKILTIGAIGLVGAIGMGGSCHDESIQHNKTSEAKYEVNEFGRSTIYIGNDRASVTSVSSADVDGDGDMDIIAGTHYGVYIIENTMPQKCYTDVTRHSHQPIKKKN